MRTCLVSRKKLPKDQLARFVIDPLSGKFTIDSMGKVRSRGANLSMDLELYDKAVRSGAFERALKSKIEGEDYADTREEFEQYIRKVQFRGNRKKVSIRIQGEKVKLD